MGGTEGRKEGGRAAEMSKLAKSALMVGVVTRGGRGCEGGYRKGKEEEWKREKGEWAWWAGNCKALFKHTLLYSYHEACTPDTPLECNFPSARLMHCI